MSHTQKKPNYTDFGASGIMTNELRRFVERQLITDLKHYKVQNDSLRFDWSNSCCEGHSTNYLGGTLENFSYVTVFDINDEFLAEGWIDFVDNFFDKKEISQVFVFWDLVSIYNGKTKLINKSEPGIPEHLWVRLDESFRKIYKDNKQKKRTIGL